LNQQNDRVCSKEIAPAKQTLALSDKLTRPFVFAIETQHRTSRMDLGLGLQGDVVVVTGAGGQIGQVIVEAFLAAGCFVGGFDIDKSKFVKEHQNLFWVAVDTTDEADMFSAWKSVEGRFNATPTLCVCAAAVDLSFVEHHSSITKMSTSQFRRTLDIVR